MMDPTSECPDRGWPKNISTDVALLAPRPRLPMLLLLLLVVMMARARSSVDWRSASVWSSCRASPQRSRATWTASASTAIRSSGVSWSMIRWPLQSSPTAADAATGEARLVSASDVGSATAEITTPPTTQHANRSMRKVPAAAWERACVWWLGGCEVARRRNVFAAAGATSCSREHGLLEEFLVFADSTATQVRVAADGRADAAVKGCCEERKPVRPKRALHGDCEGPGPNCWQTITCSLVMEKQLKVRTLTRCQS
jgi:hypothetical protein